MYSYNVYFQDQLDEAGCSKMSNIKNLKKRAQRVRAKVKNEGRVIKTFADLDHLPDNYKKLNDEPFLVKDKLLEEGRMLVFMASSGRTILQDSVIWAMDGTHEKTPNIFKQIYIVAGVYKDEHVLPAVFALLPSHDSNCYSELLSFLKGEFSKEPHRIIMDFEKAMLKSVQEIYPRTEITGCAFHFQQNIMKQIRKKGCMSHFNKDADLKKLVKMLYALMYAPPGFVVDLYTKVVESFVEEHNLHEIYVVRNFVVYFANTYIGKKKRRGRFPPVFAIDIWNQYHEVTKNTPSTNNGIEQFNSELNHNNPGKQTVYTIIKAFKREVRYGEVKRLEYLNSTNKEANPGRKEAVQRRRSEIAGIAQAYSHDNPTPFFDCLVAIL